MGNASSSDVMCYSSTSLDVVNKYGSGDYLKGRTAVVTGGNSGIGLETCKALASKGCRVVLCTRSIEAGEKAVLEEIKRPGHGKYTVESPNIVVKELDLSSLGSIKKFADDILATEERVDFLVLNAGIMAVPTLEYTEAGFEKQIGVNHFGHHYLTRLIMPKMKATSSPQSAGRVVSVASMAHSFGRVEPIDLHFKNGRVYRPWESYGQSKSANILFAKALADNLQEDSTYSHITAVSVHPGVIHTNLYRQSLLTKVAGYFAATQKSIPQGAATQLWACLAPEIGAPENRGAYLDNCQVAQPSDSCQDGSGKLRAELWEVTERQLNEALSAAGIDIDTKQ